jgi:hypothetical protein
MTAVIQSHRRPQPNAMRPLLAVVLLCATMLGLVQFSVGGVVAPIVGMVGTASMVPLAVAMLACLAIAGLLQATAARGDLGRLRPLRVA